MRVLNEEYLGKIKARYEKIEMHHRDAGNDTAAIACIFLGGMIRWLLNDEIEEIPGIPMELNEDFYGAGESNFYDGIKRLCKNMAKAEPKRKTVKVECPECGNAQNLPSYMAHGTRICCGCGKEFVTSFADNLETFDHSTVPK